MTVYDELRNFFEGKEEDNLVSPEVEAQFAEDLLLCDYEEEYQNPTMSYIGMKD